MQNHIEDILKLLSRFGKQLTCSVQQIQLMASDALGKTPCVEKLTMMKDPELIDFIVVTICRHHPR